VFHRVGLSLRGTGSETTHAPFSLPTPTVLCQAVRMRNLTATLCLTIAVILGSAGGVLENMKRVSEMKKTLIIGMILTLFSTPAFAQSGGSGGLESLLPLILIQLVFMSAFWRFAARVEMRRWVYVVLALIPFIGSFLYIYLFVRGISLILDKLDKLENSMDKDTKGVE